MADEIRVKHLPANHLVRGRKKRSIACMTGVATRLADLNQRIQLAQGMVEDRRVLIDELGKDGHDTQILRDMLTELEGKLADLKVHRDRLTKQD